MKIKLLSGVALSAVATALGPGVTVPAQAQSHNWTGFYVGLNAGGAWGQSETVTNVDCGGALPYLCNSTGTGAANATAVGAAGSGTFHPSSFTGGVQAGYNVQFNNIVVGLETDFGAFKMKSSRQVSGTLPVNGPLLALAGTAYTVGTSIETSWLFTLRGRLGVALPSNLLAYATGGLALTRLTVGNSYSDQSGAVNGSESASADGLKTGWTIGGGLEWALNKNWTVKGEYLYVDFGSVTVNGTIINNFVAPPYSQGLSTSADLTAHVARLGVNYRF